MLWGNLNGGGAPRSISRLASAPRRSCTEVHSLAVLNAKRDLASRMHPPMLTSVLRMLTKHILCVIFKRITKYCLSSVSKSFHKNWDNTKIWRCSKTCNLSENRYYFHRTINRTRFERKTALELRADAAARRTVIALGISFISQSAEVFCFVTVCGFQNLADWNRCFRRNHSGIIYSIVEHP